jgi:hypothetical protein
MRLEEITMRSIAERLQRGATVLVGLQQKRIETGEPHFGYDVEQSIIGTELQDLEQDMLSDLAVPTEELVNVRRRYRS